MKNLQARKLAQKNITIQQYTPGLFNATINTTALVINGLIDTKTKQELEEIGSIHELEQFMVEIMDKQRIILNKIQLGK